MVHINMADFVNETGRISGRLAFPIKDDIINTLFNRATSDEQVLRGCVEVIIQHTSSYDSPLCHADYKAEEQATSAISLLVSESILASGKDTQVLGWKIFSEPFFNPECPLQYPVNLDCAAAVLLGLMLPLAETKKEDHNFFRLEMDSFYREAFYEALPALLETQLHNTHKEVSSSARNLRLHQRDDGVTEKIGRCSYDSARNLFLNITERDLYIVDILKKAHASLIAAKVQRKQGDYNIYWSVIGAEIIKRLYDVLFKDLPTEKVLEMIVGFFPNNTNIE